MNLTERHCIPCEGGVKPFEASTVEEYLKETPGWKVKDNKSIEREFKFKDFKGSMSFIGKVAEIAEAEQHHPDIYVFYNRVRLELSTHSIGGLSENDFILAAKINALSA